MTPNAETSGNMLEPVTSPTVAKCDGDADHLRPSATRDAIEIANEVLEQIVGKEFRDDQLQERARPG